MFIYLLMLDPYKHLSMWLIPLLKWYPILQRKPLSRGLQLHTAKAKTSFFSLIDSLMPTLKPKNDNKSTFGLQLGGLSYGA